RGLVKLAVDLCEIGFFLLVARVRQPVGQPAVVGQEQQTLTVLVQPSSRIDVLLMDEFSQRGATIGIGELAQHAIRLVQRKQHVATVSDWMQRAPARMPRKTVARKPPEPMSTV